MELKACQLVKGDCSGLQTWVDGMEQKQTLNACKKTIEIYVSFASSQLYVVLFDKRLYLACCAWRNVRPWFCYSVGLCNSLTTTSSVLMSKRNHLNVDRHAM